MRQERKTDNKQVFFNISQLDEAIQQRKQVSFTYLEHGLDKQLHPRRDRPYVVNPYGMVYMNEHYYLVCNYVKYPNTTLYRIDRISNITILDTNSEVASDYKALIQDAVYAFAGVPERIVMHCSNFVLEEVLDRFGSDVRLHQKDEDTFTATFFASPKGIQFWALQYLPYVEVIEPKWLREEIIKSIQANKY